MAWLGAAVGGIVAGVMGATAGFRWSIRQMDKAVQSMTASARLMGLSSQRLVGEAALLKMAALRRDAGLPDYKFLEGDGE